MKPCAAVKPDSQTPGPVVARGRPRNPKARALVLRAARVLLNEDGLGAVTIEALSARTGVSKPTIYRTWPNAHAVVMAALMDAPAPAPAANSRGRGSAVATLRRQLRAIVDVFSSRTGRSITHVLASADPGTELSKVFRNHFILARRDEGRELLKEAMAGGELRARLDLEVVLDLLYAPIFYRILVGHAPLNEAFVDAAVDHLMKGLAPKRTGDA
jgi:AcrR family transcriptional regulator